MKAKALLFILVCMASAGMKAQFFHESFLTSDLYQVTMGGVGNDGKSDYFQRVTNDSIDVSYSGTDSIFFAAQDIDDGGWEGSESPSQLTWSGIDIRDMVKVRFEGLFAEVIHDAGEIDKTDGVLLQYRIDDSDWENLLLFTNDGATYNTLMYQDTDFDGAGDGVCISSAEGTMVKVAQSFYVWGDTLAFSITVNLNSGKEDVAFDEFMLFEETVNSIKRVDAGQRFKVRVVGDQLLLPDSNVGSLEIFNLSGQCVLQQDDCRQTVPVSQLKGGIYIVHFLTEEGMQSQKIIIR